MSGFSRSARPQPGFWVREAGRGRSHWLGSPYRPHLWSDPPTPRLFIKNGVRHGKRGGVTLAREG